MKDLGVALYIDCLLSRACIGFTNLAFCILRRVVCQLKVFFIANEHNCQPLLPYLLERAGEGWFGPRCLPRPPTKSAIQPITP